MTQLSMQLEFITNNPPPISTTLMDERGESDNPNHYAFLIENESADSPLIQELKDLVTILDNDRPNYSYAHICLHDVHQRKTLIKSRGIGNPIYEFVDPEPFFMRADNMV